MSKLDPEARHRVAKLAAVLRVADGLDRGRASSVGGLDVDINNGRVRIGVQPAGDIDVELWGARRKRELFERLFDRRLEVVRATKGD